VSESLLDSTTYRAIRVFAAQKIRMAEVYQQYGLHVGQEFMLAQLWREDGLTQTQLAERLRVSPPAVTKVVRGLERAELVRRTPDDADGRMIRVHLTERGQGLEVPITAAWFAVEAALFAELTPAQRDALRHLAAVSSADAS